MCEKETKQLFYFSITTKLTTSVLILVDFSQKKKRKKVKNKSYSFLAIIIVFLKKQFETLIALNSMTINIKKIFFLITYPFKSLLKMSKTIKLNEQFDSYEEFIPLFEKYCKDNFVNVQKADSSYFKNFFAYYLRTF